jgi:zinc D-Ala-D-Ala carboxypeptidase
VTDLRRRDVHRASRRRRRSGWIVAVGAIAVVALVAAVAVLWPREPQGVAVNTPSPSATVSETPSSSPTPSASPTPTFDKTKRSIDDPNSIWVVVNKARPLDPQDYVAPDLVDVPIKESNPAVLRKDAADHVVAMFQAFQDETGKEMQNQSAYRPYSVQVSVYNNWVATKGQDYADSHSARAGHSEHQTGLSLDISSVPAECPLEACFADTTAGKWLAENAWEFGFILRYPKGMDDITGYTFEPWHYRFVGKGLAKEMHDTETATLEQFFDLPPAPDYK